jgi:predicted nucleic acid-binding Zn ribbon protein
MKCLNCNKDIPNESDFCTFCGNKIKKEKDNKKKKILLIIGIILVIIVFMSLIIYLDNKNKIIEDANSLKNEENYINVSATNNKGENVIITVNKDEFLQPIQSDLDTIFNDYIKGNAKKFMLLGLYNTNSNKFNISQYWCNYEYENEDQLLFTVKVVGEENVVPYLSIDENNVTTRLVPDDTFNLILKQLNVMTERTYNDDILYISLTEGINSELNSSLMEKYLSKENDVKNDTTISQSNEEHITSTTEYSSIYQGYLQIIEDYEKLMENKNKLSDINVGNLGEYALVDIDNNGTDELIIFSGTCNADYEYVFYTFKDNKVILLGSNTGANSNLYKITSKNYIKQYYMSGQSEIIWNIKCNNDKIALEEVSYRSLETPEDYKKLTPISESEGTEIKFYEYENNEELNKLK